MLLKEILQRIQSLYSHGVQSDDTRLLNRHIYNKILTVRALLISQKLRKRQTISQWSYQNLCVNLQLAPINECPSALRKVTILRSKIKIPKPLMNMDQEALSVTNPTSDVVIAATKWNNLKYNRGGKYTADSPNWYIKDEYLYITNNKLMEQVYLTGLFEDPAEADDFENMQSCEIIQDCISPMDKDFSIDMDLLEPLIEISTKELVEQLLQTPEDRFNDAADDNSKIQK